MGTLVLNEQILLRSSKRKLNIWSLNCDDMPDLAGSSEFHTNITLDPSPTLDPHIWSNLQPELVARILAHLPLTSLFHKRLVSKSWDREIYSVQRYKRRIELVLMN
uniref:F-box domain-containing protein n=1 Tax=Physcomitrium patens TaxID=3218 RepID=A0A2K1JZR5_PHYPA|nr:hypothetical protein PHYPA_014130 [Physcomitrium patens]